MKTQVLLVATAAAAVATLLSCTRELSVDITQAFQEMTFTAAFADEGTKTDIQPNGTSVWWTGEESINVFTSSGKSAKFTSFGTEARAKAVFTGSFNGSTEEDTFYAVYPYDEANSFSDGKITLTVPTQQTAVEGSFADDLFPSVAMSNNDVFRFYHVCGGFRFTVSQEGIRRITFEAVGGESLAGKAAVSFDESWKPEAEISIKGHSCIALNAPEGSYFKTGKWYYLVALPSQLNEGFKMSFYKDGSWGSKTYGTDVTITRSIFGSKQNVDSGVSFTNYEAVDLGLPSGTLWATYNLGATSPEECGDYYAWGETEPKSNYSWANYKWCDGTSSYMTKYNSDSEHGPVDSKTILDYDDDAAHVNWGGNWRMPTESEIKELILYCSREFTTENGVSGWRLTSSINGSGIFFPLDRTSDPETLYTTYFWTSSYSNYYYFGAHVLFCNGYTVDTVNHNVYRYCGVNTRPVKSYQPSGEVPVPEAIDLGLSVKWASFNVGASKPEGYGDYFAWGETEPKTFYDYSTYKWCNGSYKSLTKYNTSSSFGTVDNRTVLELFDDAAYANLGDNWRMPTDAEWGELIDNCTWAWTTVNGVYGYKVTSNKSGYTNKTIFLPASGNWVEAALHLAGISGCYWSSSLDTDSSCARFVYFRSSEVYEDFNERYPGCSVRPVFGDFLEVSSIVLNRSSVSLDIGETTQLSTSISPSNATEKTIRWVSNNHNVVTVSESGLVTAKAAGSATITAYASNGKSASCTVTVKTVQQEPEPMPAGITVFEDDFEWMASWSGNAPDDVGSNSVGTSPNIFFSNDMDTLLSELQGRGYGYIWGYKDHDWSTDTPEGDTRTMYLQKNYLKFGKTSYNSGIHLPVLSNVEGIADVELSFNWCWCMTGKAKPDIMTLTVVVSGGGTFASNGTEVSDNINSSQPTEDDLTVLEWQTAKLRINGVTPDTRITIRPTNCDPGVSSTRNQNRWYFDNVTIVTL